MRNPFVAVDSATDLRARARVLRRSWMSAMEGAPSGDVRPVIGRSWQRLASAGLDPETLKPRRAFDRSDLDLARALSPLRHVIDILRGCLLRFADDCEHVMVVVDGPGRILWVEGHNRVRHRADKITFTEGMWWTEDSAGTNAIGTALAIDHAVQIFSAEHFLPEQHAWWCSAAPIHNPLTGESIGIVDLSGPLRTAHPDSLALVAAAASLAEDALQMRQSAADDRLRQAFLEQAPARGRCQRALISADGRVLLAQPAGWIDGHLAPPHEGRALLPGNVETQAEPVGDGGWLIYAPSGRSSSASAEGLLRLQLLGPAPYTAQVDGNEPVALSARHAEILALLVIHSEGLTCDQLTLYLYGELGNPISTRAEMSRLRRLIGPALTARPYRLTGEVDGDFLEVERLLAVGDIGSALETYRGPLLPASQAPAIEQARENLEWALARSVRRSSALLWRWLRTERGREDEEAMAAFIRSVPAADPRQSVVAARLRSQQRRVWTSTPDYGAAATLLQPSTARIRSSS